MSFELRRCRDLNLRFERHRTCQEVGSLAGRPLEPEAFKEGGMLINYTAALSDEL